jgi:hypothetical protein
VARSAVSFYWRRPGPRIWAAVVLAVIVAGIVLVARLIGQAAGGDGATPTPDGGAAPTAGSSPVDPSEGDDSVFAGPDASPGSRGAPAAAVSTGSAFLRAWLRPAAGTSQATWFLGVSRYADPTLTAQLKDVDPATNPATRLTGTPRGTALSPTSAQITVATDAGQATVLCIRSTAGWQVATVDLGAG